MSSTILGGSTQAQTVVVRAGPYYIPAKITSSGNLLFSLSAEENLEIAHLTAAAIATLQHSSVSYNPTPCYPIRTTVSVYPMGEQWYPIIVSAAANPKGTMQIIVKLKTQDPATDSITTRFFGQSQEDAVQSSTEMAQTAQLPFNANLGPLLHAVATTQQIVFARIEGANSVYFSNQ